MILGVSQRDDEVVEISVPSILIDGIFIGIDMDQVRVDEFLVQIGIQCMAAANVGLCKQRPVCVKHGQVADNGSDGGGGDFQMLR